MSPTNEPADDWSLAPAVQRCKQNADFLNSLAQFYQDADASVDAQAAKDAGEDRACMGGGTCCRFDLMGHRLYLSTGELAFLSQATLPAGRQFQRLRCPFQVGPRCMARQFRPLGCRIFFCRRKSLWQQDTYEYFHSRIRNLHDQNALPYRYMEMTAALHDLDDAGELRQ